MRYNGLMSNLTMSLIASCICLLVACPMLVIVGWFLVVNAYDIGMWIGGKIGGFFASFVS